jgi:alkaline phosphatase D
MAPFRPTAHKMKPLAPIVFLLLAGCAAQAPRENAEPFTHGVASGDMRGDSAVLWTRTREAATLVPELSTTPGFEMPARLAPIQSRAETDFTARTVATDLRPGSRYYYRFRVGDAVSRVGTFRTPYAPEDHATVRMAFTGDADWKWKPYPLAASLAQENLDFFFFLGDVVYESQDYDGKSYANDLPGYRAKYRENREPHPNSASGVVPLRDLYAAFGQYSVFDNHELGNAPEGGARTSGRFVNRSAPFQAGVRAFAEYQPVRSAEVAGTGDARLDGTGRFYYALPWGANVELIVVDDRSYRDARIENTDDPQAASCSRTMLGLPQLAWLEQALAAAQRRGAVWKVVIISSPIQELGRASQVQWPLDSSKSWAGNYRCERSRLLKFIDDNAIDNVVFLTTDNHYTSINQLAYDTTPGDERSPRKHARNAFEIITGPMGAIAGSPLRGQVAIADPGTRGADSRIVTILNDGMKRAGLDPIGLEADFPGLDAASVRIAGRPPGALDPVAFASYATYSYAVLTFDQSQVHVQLKSMPYVADPKVLRDDAAAERAYEARRPVEASSFVVRAVSPGTSSNH